MNMGKMDYQQEIENILKQMTLEEKTKLIHGAGFFRTEGIDRLSIPPIKFSDGPMGVRADFQNAKWLPAGTADDYVSYLPSNSALASTWNKEMAYRTGQILGCEARGRGKDMILAPGINIKRSPLCGRNFEYMSEDPKLIEEITVPLIQGIQENDVSACVKHFAVNSQETDRLMVDTLVDERAARELYFPGFKAAVQKADVLSVMGAYNKLWGTHCCENKRLLDEILRQEWGFDGTVVSDWSAVHRTKEAAEVSLDIEMSVTDDFDEYKLANPLIEEIKAGRISEECVDQKIRNILRMMFRLKMIGPDKANRKSGEYNTPAHRQGIYEVATESMILLKNEQETLPLLKAAELKKVAVIGQNADFFHALGGGSAEIRALYEIPPLMGLEMRLGGNVEVCFAPGYYVPTKEELKDENWQKDSANEVDLSYKEPVKIQISQHEIEERQKRLDEAIKLAKECDSVIFVGGLNHDYDVEGKDREDMKLPYNQDEVIEALLKVNPKTVVVIHAGSPVEMPWREKAKAIVWSYYAGMEYGVALADVLLGKVNPSGKLAETFPICYEDTPTAQNGQFGLVKSVTHTEGIFVGYRYYESQNKKTAFCFGHGLSYTDFEYDKLKVQVSEENKLSVEVKLQVKNTGKRAGAEIVQLYIGESTPSIQRPIKELKGFCKVFLQPGEVKEVKFELNEEAFGYYDQNRKSFFSEKGIYNISVGASLEDIRLKGELTLKNTYTYS